MKPLTFLFSLAASLVMFSSASFAEWVKLSTTLEEDTSFYVDIGRIKKHKGFVYYWGLDDFVFPDEEGDLSVTKYVQVDCNLLRRRILNGNSYVGPMGSGKLSSSYQPENPKWDYAPPGSSMEEILETVCNI